MDLAWRGLLFDFLAILLANGQTAESPENLDIQTGKDNVSLFLSTHNVRRATRRPSRKKHPSRDDYFLHELIYI